MKPQKPQSSHSIVPFSAFILSVALITIYHSTYFICCFSHPTRMPTPQSSNFNLFCPPLYPHTCQIELAHESLNKYLLNK